MVRNSSAAYNLLRWFSCVPLVCFASASFCQEPSQGDEPTRPPTLFSENSEAEIDANTSFEPIAESSSTASDETVDAVGRDLTSPDASTTKILNENTPDWVKEGLVMGDDHKLAISSSLFPDREQCKEDLKVRLMIEVRSYLDKHVLRLARSSQLPELTQEYVEANWVVANREFDNVQDRPSGTYHQLWMELQISAEQLEVVRGWEKSRVREKRVKQVGVLGGMGIAAITCFSAMLGVLARREKAKLIK